MKNFYGSIVFSVVSLILAGLLGYSQGGVSVAMQRVDGQFAYTAWLRPGSHVLIGTAEAEAALGDTEALDVTVPVSGGSVVLAKSQM